MIMTKQPFTKRQGNCDAKGLVALKLNLCILSVNSEST